MDAITANRDITATVNAVKVRELRRLKGLRWGWVAEQLGISPSLLSLMLSGQRRWTPERIEKLADVLGVTVGELR